MRIRSTFGIQVVVVMGSLALSVGTARAQFTGPAVTTQSANGSATAAALTAKYGDVMIMPGDIVAIATYGAPELTTSAVTSVNTPGSISNTGVQGITVGAQGEIVLPYLGVVKIAGMTPPQAAEYLDKALKDGGFLVDPQVTVELVDSPTRVVTVVGEVTRPQPVPAFGQLRLLDVISACGGFTPLASHTLTVRRRDDPQPITIIMGTDPQSTDSTNIPLMAGDTVIVPKVGNIFVVGQVKNPEAIPLSSNLPITVMRAISMSGGVNYGAALSKVTVIRTTPDNHHVEITMDLAKIMKGKEKDMTLISDDVLLVPTQNFKASIAAGAAGAAASSLYGIGYIAK